MKKPKSTSKIRDCLALAATSLVASSAHASEAGDQDWDFAASVLGYSEQDRVSAAEFTVTADKTFRQTARLSVKAVLDTLTGASANGAVAQPVAQTFTSPSGEATYGAAVGETPLDSTFKDTRGQFSISWQDALSEESRYTVGGYVSAEHDYASISVNAEYARDFNQKNTTFSIAGSFGNDLVKPEGDIPVAFSSMVIDQGQFANEDAFENAWRATRGESDDTISTGEVLLGLTQVINRRMLMQFNVGHAQSSGYLTDPYKLLSELDSQGQVNQYLYERRPDSRTKDSFFALTKYHFDDSVFDFSYRYMSDDWGVKSHTFDTHWHIFAANDSFWEPHLRFYDQAAADFYKPWLNAGESLPEFASADYRLADLQGWTLGLKYGFKMDSGHRAEVKAEVYRQQVKSSLTNNLPALQGLDLQPDVTAVIVQFSYFF